MLLDLVGGSYFGLNEVGGAIWQGLRDGLTPNEVADLLVERYDVPLAVVLRDTVGVIDQLLERGLVEIVE